MKCKQELRNVPSDPENSSGVGNFMPRVLFLLRNVQVNSALHKFSWEIPEEGSEMKALDQIGTMRRWHVILAGVIRSRISNNYIVQSHGNRCVDDIPHP